MAVASEVDRLYREHEFLVQYLSAQKQVSFVNDVDASFRKVLLLAAASHFEGWLRSELIEFFRERSNGDECVVMFARNKGVERQFHTYFDWQQRNANQFFGLFGTAFKRFMKAAVEADDKLSKAISSFLELGALRNSLVHEDFAVFAMEKTVDEIYELYLQSLEFRKQFPRLLRDFSARTPSDQAAISDLPAR